ncbi:MAG TPA: hypothetical protein VGJ96_00575 [Gemmatimonadaceae bacterium]|jgi:hypothetical protein
MRRVLVLLATVVASLPAQQKGAPPTPSVAPLAQYTSVKVAVVPVQFYLGDTNFVKLPAMAMRAAFDSLVSASMEEHGLKGTWASPSEVIRAARRNAMYSSDPHNLGAFPVRNGTGKDGTIPDPLAANLRRLVALHDARYALMPVELRVDGGAGSVRLVVRMLLVDARLMKALFQVDLAGEGAAAYSPALLQKLAARVVELAVAP